jgi:hypothetical protein
MASGIYFLQLQCGNKCPSPLLKIKRMTWY